MVRQTSKKAYMEILPEIGKNQEKVYEVIKNNPGISDTEIAIKLMKSISCITPRRNELVKMGLVVKNGTKEGVMKKTVCKWKVVGKLTDAGKRKMTRDLMLAKYDRITEKLHYCIKELKELNDLKQSDVLDRKIDDLKWNLGQLQNYKRYLL